MLKVRWKQYLQEFEWYKNNPADEYLDKSVQKELIEAYCNGEIDDLDSEAEVYEYLGERMIVS